MKKRQNLKADDKQKIKKLTDREEKVLPTPIANIIPNPYLCFNYKDEDIKGIADSIESTDKIVPPNFIKVGDKFQIFTGLDTYEAFKHRGEKTIPGIVRENITDDQAMLLGVKDLLGRPDISPADKENIFHNLMNSGKFKSDADLSRKIGGKPTPQRIGHLCDVKPIREKGAEKLKMNVSFVPTEIFIAIKSLPLNLQCLIIESHIEGKLIFKDMRDTTREFAEFFEPLSHDQQKAILDYTIPWDRAKYILESRYPKVLEILEKVKSKLHEKKTLEEAVTKEIPKYDAGLLRELSNLFKELEPMYIDDIKDETERKQAEKNEDIAYALFTRLRYKRKKMDKALYKTILKTTNLDPETVEQNKERGHNLDFESEYKTPTVKKLEEKSRLLDTGRKDPVKQVLT